MGLFNKFTASIQRFAWFLAENIITLKIYEWLLWNRVKEGLIPEHIGVILDGNRRWAINHGFDPSKGHEIGADIVENFLDWCFEIGRIKTTTLYIFSTENFIRSKEEVEEIMRLLDKYLQSLAKDRRIRDHKIRVKAIGRLETLPPNIQETLSQLEGATKSHDQYYLNLAIAYGGRSEIVDAVKKIAVEVKEGRLNLDGLDEEAIEKSLYTNYLPNPNPDLIIRTSGEERLSNFLLWQSAYSELCFLDVYWPGFRKIDLLRAIRIYQKRKRRFGG